MFARLGTDEQSSRVSTFINSNVSLKEKHKCNPDQTQYQPAHGPSST
ncbi:hypothetical protein HYR82_04170 [Candidatus Peregrinibacteria bacterium]|nr:hypothetical protein [Candidatus Peregrinibacteria bacterium]